MKGAVLLWLVAVFTLVATVGAGPPTAAPGNSGEHAVVPLGPAFDTDGRAVEGFAIVHFRPGFGHKDGHNPGGGGGKGGGGKGGGGCFAFLANGARWKATEPYTVDPTVSELLTETSLEAWDSQVGFEVFGQGTVAGVDGADDKSPDGKNEVLFGSVAQDGAIAVTIVWGIFRGPPGGRELVEWDAVFDDEDFEWSTVGEDGKMDFQNLATHEFGHAAGMGHPSDECTEETMYRFAGAGEVKKQTLEAGDIAGIEQLYGG